MVLGTLHRPTTVKTFISFNSGRSTGRSTRLSARLRVLMLATRSGLACSRQRQLHQFPEREETNLRITNPYRIEKVLMIRIGLDGAETILRTPEITFEGVDFPMSPGWFGQAQHACCEIDGDA